MNPSLPMDPATLTNVLLKGQITSPLVGQTPVSQILCENLPVLFYIKNIKDLKYEDCSSAWANWLGYTREERLGKADAQFLPQTLSHAISQSDRRVIEAGQTSVNEQEPFVTRNGVRFARCRRILIPGPDGRPLYLLGHCEVAQNSKSGDELSPRLQPGLQPSEINEQLREMAQEITSGFANMCEVILIREPFQVADVIFSHQDPQMIEWALNHRSAFTVDWNANWGAGKVLRTGHPDIFFKITNATLDELVHDLHRREALRFTKIHSNLILPLIIDHQLVGSIGFGRSTTIESFTELDLSTAQRFAQQAQSILSRAQKPTPSNLNAAQSRGQVLIVDDAPDNRLLIQHYVIRLGYQVEIAASGPEAVEKALKTNFDVILMDVQMPEMDGFEVVKRLRSHGCCTPIVALTAHTMKGDRERCLANGFDDFLGKPVDRNLLTLCLKRYSDSSGH